MAHRGHVQDEYGLKRPGPVPVFEDLPLKGLQIGPHVGVAVDHPLGFRCGSRGANDLDDVRGRDSPSFHVAAGRKKFNLMERKRRDVDLMGFDSMTMDQGFGSNVQLNAASQARGEVEIYRNHLDPLGQASPEGHHPLNPILTPEKTPVAFLKACLIQAVAECGDLTIELPAGNLPGSEPAVKANRFPLAEAPHGGEHIRSAISDSNWARPSGCRLMCAKRQGSTSGNR